MELDKELFDRILDIGQGMKPDFFTVPGEPPHVYCRRDTDGTFSYQKAEPTPRANTAFDLSTIIAHAGRVAELVMGKEEPERMPEIWYSHLGVILLLDSSERRDFVKMPLDLSTQLKKLTELQKNQPSLTQAQTLRELRITYRGCLGSSNIVDILRQVKFNATQDSESSIQHGKSSIGKTLTAQVTGTGTLPPEINITVPVFEQPELKMIKTTIPVCLEPNAETATFSLIPPPGSITAAIGDGERQLFDRITEMLDNGNKFLKMVSLYFGKP